MPARAGVARDIEDGTIAQGRHARLKQAVHRHRAASRQGLQERLFTLAFSGLVYPQIWEDPVVDTQALQLRDGERIAAIASGGCNVLSYLTAADVEIAAIDLNPAHVALNRLKLAAARHMPSYAAFYRFFGQADQRANIAAYFEHIQPHLDAATRRYWESRDGLGRRRIGYFRSGLYRQGLLGRFIGASHALARLHGRDPRRLLAARTLPEQRRTFERELAPLFAKRHIRWLLERPASLFGLGIPPAQFAALKGDESHMANVILARLERLACAFDIQDNYFAWQAFGRGYASGGAGPLPPYLRPENFAALRARAHRVEVHNRSYIEHLAAEPPATVDAFVLLDAQDWMTDPQLTALWQQIMRAARPGARVVFRTAGERTILPGRIPDDILRRFSYDEERCRQLAQKDRSCIYGGFHLYVLGGETKC